MPIVQVPLDVQDDIYSGVFNGSLELMGIEGQELYAIVPPNKKGQIMVYASEITEEGVYADDKSKSLFTGKPGEVLILKY